MAQALVWRKVRAEQRPAGQRAAVMAHADDENNGDLCRGSRSRSRVCPQWASMPSQGWCKVGSARDAVPRTLFFLVIVVRLCRTTITRKNHLGRLCLLKPHLRKDFASALNGLHCGQILCLPIRSSVFIVKSA